MKLVLDSNALWHRPLVLAIADASAQGFVEDGRLEAVLPAVAYAERVRQLRAAARDVDRWRDDLEAMGIRIEPLTAREAERLPPAAMDAETWRRHARDLLVAAHAHSGREIVTDDKGPTWQDLGAMTPAQATKALRAMLDAIR